MGVGAYDYDGGFDQLIGTVKIKCEDLDIHEGLAKPPPAKWYTLLDASGKDKTKDGDPYGDVLIQAYIDEEYLHHMHLQKVRVSDEPDQVFMHRRREMKRQRATKRMPHDKGTG